MNTNKSISYILWNEGIIVNLYKLHFSSFHFSPTKQKSFPPSHFSTPPTKHTRGKIKYFPSSHFSTPPSKRTLNFCGPKGKQIPPIFSPFSLHNQTHSLLIFFSLFTIHLVFTLNKHTLRLKGAMVHKRLLLM